MLKTKTFNPHIFIFVVIGIAILLFSGDAFATAGSGGGFEYESWLTKINNSIKGPVAYSIALASIVAAGAMLAWGGELSGFIKTLVYIACVIGLIIGGAKFLGQLTGTSAEVPYHQTIQIEKHD